MTDPAQPVTIAMDGPEVHRYLVTGATTLYTPEVQRHQPIDLTMPCEADAVYVAPASFHAALAPLLAHRRAQGFRVEVIDVAAIDERLLPHPHGGAIATWGPTDLGIVHDHDAKERGFYRMLWSRSARTTLPSPFTGRSDL